MAAGVLILLDHPGSSGVVNTFTPFIYSRMTAFIIALVPYCWLSTEDFHLLTIAYAGRTF